jgi:two-component system NtrC family sensor kinase
MKMEQQLLIASKLASIGELAAGVAHEINNPLTAITGFAQLLIAEEGLPEQVKQDLEKIYIQSQRAAKIVQNLLTFSRSYSLEKKVIDINEVITKTLEMRSYEHRVNNIDVICDLYPALPGISADETRYSR